MIYNQALVAHLQKQRNDALDFAAQVVAEKAALQEKIDTLQADLKDADERSS